MNDLKTYNLYGNPKTMCLYIYRILAEPGLTHNTDSQAGLLRLSYSDHSIFNRFGNETERIRMNAQNKMVFKDTFSFDKEDRLIMHYNHATDGFSMKHVYRYDKKGLCRGMDFYIYGFIPGEFHYYSEEKDGRSQSEVYDIEGELLWITYYTNDERGNLLELKKVWADGRIVEHYISTYDDQNRETERAGLVMDFCNRMVIRFDEKENESEIIHYDYKDRIEKHFVNEYTFDIFGNWIKKTIFLNGTIHVMEEREFVYYEKENKCKA